jgi:hypothetical protein
MRRNMLPSVSPLNSYNRVGWSERHISRNILGLRQRVLPQLNNVYVTFTPEFARFGVSLPRLGFQASKRP